MMNTATEKNVVPGVSVIIPCFNAAEHLREALDSVVSQVYDGNIEIIVVDDGSTDDSCKIVESYGDRIRLLRNPPGRNSGPAVPRNLGILASKEEFIAFTDADDYFLPGHISALASKLRTSQELGLVYNKAYYITKQGKTIGPMYSEPHLPRTTPELLLLDQCFGVGSVMIRRSVLDQVGLFDESICGADDHDLWLRIVERYPACHVPVFGFCYRLHSGQLSHNPIMWRHAQKVLDNAISRYPYPSRAIRKRRAVLAYRHSQISYHECRYLKSLWLILKAACYDPSRSVRELYHRIAGKRSKSTSERR
jgi:glycosyltransferase involved in cell wall biosynthesis